MLYVIDARIGQSPIQCNWRHVKVHQDNQVVPLDRWASLKVKYDIAKNKIWDQDQDNPRHTIRHKLEHVICRLYSNVPISSIGEHNTDQGNNISTKLSDSIDLSLFSPSILECWNKIPTLNKDTQHLIDWKPLELATNTAPRTR